MVKMYKGRCPDCGKITPVTKGDWHKAVRCQWCFTKFVPFYTQRGELGPKQVYEKEKTSKSIAKWSEKVLGRKVA